MIPTFTKTLKFIIKARIKLLIVEKQNSLQRGFTNEYSTDVRIYYGL